MLPIIAAEFRLATEPELRFAPSGTAVVKMRLVASSQKRQDDGSWSDDKTLWLGATAFGTLAEHIADTFAKGDLVIVTGRLVTEEWEREGQRRSEVRMLVDSAGPSIRFRQIPHGSAGGPSREPGPQERRSSDRSSAQQADDYPPF